MKFIRAEAHEGARAMVECLRLVLGAGSSVLWFVSGGSNIPLSVEIMDALPTELTPKLTIIPIDERYGPIGHKDSNAQQLSDAGFKIKQATFVSILDGSSLEDTTAHFANTLEQHLTNSAIVIGQLGIAKDGHIAGILPHSPAVQARGTAVSYNRADGHVGITATFSVLRRITTHYVFAYGESKRIALLNLRDKDLSLDEQPAQILKSLPDVYIYNDQIEEN
jgi:6-phosphogluconolactonase/glucosamine-6-phosphate isomerase/deaminase